MYIFSFFINYFFEICASSGGHSIVGGGPGPLWPAHRETGLEIGPKVCRE